MHKSVLYFAPCGGKQAYRHRILLATLWKENVGLFGQLAMCVAVSFYARHVYCFCYYFGFKAEEAPSALLLAQAALLSAKKQATRRAALWYVSAAGRLEKCGIVSPFFCRARRTLMVISLETLDYVFPTESAGVV
jgi:hypothetical protein